MKFHFLAYIISIAALAGCTRESLTTPDTPPTPCTKAEYITLASPKLQDTKGTPIDGVENLLNFYFTAVSHTKDWDNPLLTDEKKKVVDNKEVKKDNSNKWVYFPVEYWPNNTNVSAFGYTLLAYEDVNATSKTAITIPADKYGEYGLTVDNSEITPKITYKVPTDVTKQPDLVVAIKPNNTQQESTSGINMKFQHALASIGFSGVSPHLLRSVESITISNVRDEGTLLLGRSESAFAPEIEWKLETTTTTPAPSVNMSFLPSTVNEQTNELYSLMSGDGYLMMLPQTLATAAKITIKFNTGIEKVFDIGNTEWEAGKKYIYQFRVGAITTYYEKYSGGGDIGLYFYEYYLDEEGVQQTDLVNTLTEGKVPIEAGYGFLSRSDSFKGKITWSNSTRVITAPAPIKTEQKIREEPKEKYYLYCLDQSKGDVSILPLIADVENLATNTDYHTYYGSTAPQVLKIDGLECEGYCLPHFAKGVYTTQDAQKAFEIRTPQQMQNISFNAIQADESSNNSVGCTYEQTLDLDFSTSSIGGVPVKSAVVKGYLYGYYQKPEKHTEPKVISNAKINYTLTSGNKKKGNIGTDDNGIMIGLFQYMRLENKKLQNFKLSNSTITFDKEGADVTAETEWVFIGGFVAMCYAGISNLEADNLVINETSSYRTSWYSFRAAGGIVGYLNYHYNKNSTLENCNNKNGAIRGLGNVGGIIGLIDVQSPAEIKDCSNSSPITRDYTCFLGAMGGIAGKLVTVENSNVKISNCVNSGEITSSDGIEIGGIIGMVNLPYGTTAISECENSAPVNGGASGLYTGGIVGNNTTASITSCINSGTVKCSSAGLGGIVGSNGGEDKDKNIHRPIISGCTNSGAVTGGANSFNVGGIAGESYGTIKGCENSKEVLCERNGYTVAETNPIWTGGIVGNNIAGATVESCTNTANVKGWGSVFGGIAGINFGTINNCINDALIGFTTISADGYKYSKSVGGIAGGNGFTGTIKYCTNTGEVATSNRNVTTDNTSDVGGIVGTNRNIVEHCLNRGNISGTGSNAGGIAGSNIGGYPTDNSAGYIRFCGSHGNNVTAKTAVGGIVGKNFYYVHDVLYVGSTTATQLSATGTETNDKNNIGGIAGVSEIRWAATASTSAKDGSKIVRALFYGVAPQRDKEGHSGQDDRFTPIAGEYGRASMLSGGSALNPAIVNNAYTVYNCLFLAQSSSPALYHGWDKEDAVPGYDQASSLISRTADQLKNTANIPNWGSSWSENWQMGSSYPELNKIGYTAP